MFKAEQREVEGKIREFCKANHLPEPILQWNSIPFSGHWGIATSFFSLAAQEARQNQQKINVGQRAQELAEQVKAYLGIPSGFERIEAVKGYLNLYYSSIEFTRRVIDTTLEQKNRFGWGEPKGQRVMIEFSQPNTHKSIHVGHLRNIVLGAAVANIYEAAGYDVVRTTYPGDIGLHVVKWMWNYLTRHAGEQPGEDKMRWIQEIYTEADRRYSSEPEAEQQVRQLFARWERRDADIVDLWKKSREWSMEGFHQFSEMMGVCFDRIYFESEVEEPGKEMVKTLIQAGLAQDERPEGPVIVKLDEILGNKEEQYRVLVVLRSDGTSLYATKDLALAIMKFNEYRLDRSVYVIDVRQSLYMKQIFKTLELMGYPWAKDLYHLAYEIVNLPGNVTMKSREGTVVMFSDLIREANQRALEIVQEKNPELSDTSKMAIAHAVALGALKYSMLSRDNTKIVTFDWEAALDFNGQAAPYIQYAHVRASSILRKAGGEPPTDSLFEGTLEPVEITLIDLISRLPREIQRAAIDFRPLYLANLAFDLARAFNDFYNQCPVLTADTAIRAFRLRLVAAARQAISNTLALLGITAPEAM